MISLKNSDLEVEFDVERRDYDDDFLAADVISLIKLAPVALFSDYKLSSTEGKKDILSMLR